MNKEIKAFNPLSNVKLSDLKDSRLIIPSISIGNIPQLTNDLLIHTLELDKIGSLNDTYLYPFASPIDSLSRHEVFKGISTAVEIYYSEKLNLTLIQQRSPIIPSYTRSYVNDVIIPFIKESNITQFIILDSSDAGLMEGLSQGTIKLYSNEDLLNKSLESLNLEQGDPIQLGANIYGHSSYIRSLITCLNSSDLPPDFDINVLVSYVYEGDNFYDGEQLANKALGLLKLEPVSEWIRPKSWLGVYGDRKVPNATEEGLYG